jgi:hypothetical protein
MLKTAYVVASFSLLAGCASTVFDPRACPRERVYTRAEQTAIADAMPRTPPVIVGALIDYTKLRDQSRACRGERVP